jgi:hypothetical protein
MSLFSASSRVSVRDNLALLCLAALAIGLVVVRMRVQSITIDEANVALGYVIDPRPMQWTPTDENHVLSTALERLTLSVFPLSELTIRIPALLGATLYICAALSFCLRLTTRKILQLPLFLCLVLNPLILDFLVIARGYCLAMGFLLAAITLIADTLLGDESTAVQANLRSRCVWVSVLAALSVASNFAFTIVNAATLLLFCLWAAKRFGKGFASLAASCFLPGLAIGLVLCLTALWNPISHVDPAVGTRSLREMWRIMVAASFDNLNPEVVNPLLLVWTSHIRLVLPYLSVVAFVVLLAGVAIRRRDPADTHAHRLWSLARLLASIAALTLLLHWIALRTLHILLPKGRASLFLVLLLTLLFGVALAFWVHSTGRRAWSVVSGFGTAVLLAVAIYFIGCLRMTYFEEWRYDSATRQLYWILTGLHERCGITRFAVDWRYHSPVNFYRAAYGRYSLPEFPMVPSSDIPADRDAYALFYSTSEYLIQSQRLQVVYHDDESGAAIAIRQCEASK